MSVTARRLSLLIAIFAVLGIAVSSVSLDHHFRKSKTSYCDFGQSFNCDLVNRSEYSTLAGIPVALIGILGYAALLAFAERDFQDARAVRGRDVVELAIG